MNNQRPKNKARLALYHFLQNKSHTKAQITRSEILNIYKKYILPVDKYCKKPEHTEAEMKKNADRWFRQSLAAMVIQGWMGLTFLREEKEIKEINKVEHKYLHGD